MSFLARVIGSCALLLVLAVAAPAADSGSIHSTPSSLEVGGFGPNMRISDPSVNARKMLPNVAVDGKGGVYAVYVEDAGTGKDIYLSVSKDWGKTWSRMGRANDVQGKVWSAQQAQPAIAADPASGNIYVAWTDNRAGNTAYDIYAARSTDGGASFGASVKVDQTTSGAQLSIRLGVDSSGTLHAAWANEQVLPARLGYARSTNQGQSFETPKWIDQPGSETCECCAPAFLFGSGGEIQVVYRTGTSQSKRNTVVVKSANGGGSFGAAATISDYDWTASGCPSTGPAVARDANGDLHVLSADVRSGDRDVYHYKSTDGGSTWSAGKRLNTPTAGSQDQPTLIAAGGELIAMWEDRGSNLGDIIYRISSDRGATWTPEARLNDDTANAQEFPLAAASGDAAYAIWGDSRSGGNEVWGCAYFGADSQPPSVSITAPGNGSVVGGNVNVSADASDNIVVMKVEFQVDGSKKGEATVSPYLWTWDTNAETDGPHTVKAVAYDGAGNTAQASVDVEVKNQGADKDPPTVAFKTPASGATVQGTLTVEADATDNKGVADVEFFVDATPIGKAAAAPYQVSWDSTQVADGAHTLLARATDTSGNQANASIPVTVDQAGADTTPPSVRIDAPLGGSTIGGIVKVKSTITDNKGVVSATLKVDAVSKGDLTAPPWQWDLDTTKLSDGSHTLRVEAQDAAGNLGYAEISMKTNNSALDLPPSVSFLAPKESERVKTKYTVRAGASDDRKVESVTFYLDGVSQYKDTQADWTWEWDTTKVKDGEHRLTANATDSVGQWTVAVVTVVVANGPGGTPVTNGILGLGEHMDYAVAAIVILVIAGIVVAATRGKKDRQREYDAHLRNQGWR
jgi:hypothetical protein